MLQFNKAIIFKSYWKALIIPFCYKKIIYTNINNFIKIDNISLNLCLNNIQDSKEIFNLFFKIWLLFYLFFGQKGKIVNIQNYYKVNKSNRVKLTKIFLKIFYNKIFAWNFFSNLFILKNIKTIDCFFFTKKHTTTSKNLKLSFNLTLFIKNYFSDYNITNSFLQENCQSYVILKKNYINTSKNNVIALNHIIIKQIILYLL